MFAKDKVKDSGQGPSNQSKAVDSPADKGSKGSALKNESAREQGSSKNNGNRADSSGNEARERGAGDRDSKNRNGQGDQDRGGGRGHNSRDRMAFYDYPSRHRDHDFEKLKGKLLIKLIKAIDHYRDQKVVICHKGHAISVPRESLCAHLAHGDTIGSCEVTPTKNP